jgi:hypothetical protein
MDAELEDEWTLPGTRRRRRNGAENSRLADSTLAGEELDGPPEWFPIGRVHLASLAGLKRDIE